MKKITIRLFGLLLAAVLVFSSSLSVWAFAKNSVKHYDVYTCLGDSNAAGYGTSGYLTSPIPSSTAYHTLVANATGAELRQFGLGAFRTVDMLYMLDPDFEMNWAYALTAGSDIRVEALDFFKEDYVQAVIDADLITVQIGSNDLAENINSIIAILNQPIPGIEALKQKIDPSNTLLRTVIDLLDQAIRFAKVSIALYQYGKEVSVKFGERFDRIMKNIYRLNPDVDVVVLGLENAFDNVCLSPQLKIEVGKIYALASKQINNWMKYKSAYVDQYIYCDLSGIQYPRGTMADIPLNPEYQFYILHLLDDGHAQVAQRILNVLPND